MRRFDQFLRVRSKSTSGEFDPADVDLQELFGTAVPETVVRSAVEPAGHIVDGRDVAARVSGSVAHEDDAQEPRNDATLDQVGPAVAAPNLEFKTSCDDEQILRNEAVLSVVSGPLPVVSGPLSVDRCEAGAVDEPVAPHGPDGAEESGTTEAAGCEGDVTNDHVEERSDAATPAAPDRERSAFFVETDGACDREARSLDTPLTRPAADLSLQGRGEEYRGLPLTRASGKTDRPRPDGETVAVKEAGRRLPAASLNMAAPKALLETNYDDELFMRNKANFDCSGPETEAASAFGLVLNDNAEWPPDEATLADLGQKLLDPNSQCEAGGADEPIFDINPACRGNPRYEAAMPPVSVVGNDYVDQPTDNERTTNEQNRV
jgi:hypothetical protein